MVAEAKLRRVLRRSRLSSSRQAPLGPYLLAVEALRHRAAASQHIAPISGRRRVQATGRPLPRLLYGAKGRQLKQSTIMQGVRGVESIDGQASTGALLFDPIARGRQARSSPSKTRLR